MREQPSFLTCPYKQECQDHKTRENKYMCNSILYIFCSSYDYLKDVIPKPTKKGLEDKVK